MDWQTSVKTLSEAVAYLYENNEMANVLFVVGQAKEVGFSSFFDKLILLGSFGSFSRIGYAFTAFLRLVLWKL